MNEHGAKFKQSIKWELLSSVYSQAIQFVLSVILARLLSPSDFGIVAIAYVVIRIAEIFSDVGFSSAVIRESKLSDLTISTVFWINLLMGIFFLGLFQFIANPIAQFYNEDKIASIIMMLGIVFFVDSLWQIQATLLRKNLNFKQINLITASSQTISGITAIILAFAGWGIWSLVAQTLLNSLMNFVLYWYYGNWRPALIFSYKEAKRLFAFGSYVFIAQLIGRISLRLDTILLGKYFSTTILGFYNRADSLLALLKRYSSSSIIKVVYPYLSIIRDDEREFTTFYYRLTGLIYFLTFLAVGFLNFTGRELIILVYGDKWLIAGQYFEIICFTVFFLPINSVMHNVLLSKGYSKIIFMIGLAAFFVRLSSSIMVIIVFKNIQHFLYAQILISILFNFIFMIIISRTTEIHLKHQIRQFLVVISLFLTSWLFSWVIVSSLELSSNFFESVVKGILFLTSFILLNSIFNYEIVKLFYSQLINFFKLNVHK